MTRAGLHLRSLIVLGACVALAACTRPSSGTPAAAKPALATRGIILISLDTLGAGHLGLYGYELPTSPFLDRLAQRATVFETAIVPLPGTLPSHVSMLTGLYPFQHGVYPPDRLIPSDVRTLPEQLQEMGFATWGFTEGGYVSGRYGFQRGFDRFADPPRPLWAKDNVFVRGLEVLDAVEPERRFFLFLHTYIVHDPYFPRGKYKDRFWTEPVPPGAFEPTGPNLAQVNRGSRAIDAQTAAYFRSLYDAEIRYLDDTLQKFFAELGRRGLLDETTVIVTADHGEEFLEHGKLVHEQVFHETLHVPLLVAHPSIGHGRRIPGVVSTVDITPTILHLVGERVRPGRSLVPFLEGTETASGRSAYAEGFAAPDRAVYKALAGSTFHLIELATGEKRLYDVVADPSEQHDLAPKRLGIVKALTEELIAIRGNTPRREAPHQVLESELEDQLRGLGYIK